MFPIALNLEKLSIALVGNGEKTVKRLSQLKEAGAKHITIFADTPCKELEGEGVEKRLPLPKEVANFAVTLIVDLPEEKAAKIAGWVREAGRLVNVEDVKDYCDFYFMSTVRQGDLLIAISTNGQSPHLAKRIKELLQAAFTGEWKGRLEKIGNLRDAWRKEGQGFTEIMERTDACIEENGWFGDSLCPRHRK